MSDNIRNSDAKLTQAEQAQVKRILRERRSLGVASTQVMVNDTIATVVADRKAGCCGHQLKCHGGVETTT